MGKIRKNWKKIAFRNQNLQVVNTYMSTLPHSTKGASELIKSWEGSIFCKSNADFDKNQKKFRFKKHIGKPFKSSLTSSIDLNSKIKNGYLKQRKTRNALQSGSVDYNNSNGSKFKRFLDMNKNKGVY